jgi:hypothetical protein
MIRNFRRTDKNIAEKIHKYRGFLEGESEEDQFFACLMKFDATLREQVWGRFWVWMNQTKPTKEEWAYYCNIFRRIENAFNTDREKRHKDDEAGGVPMYTENEKGVKGYVWLQKILSGKHALATAKWCDLPIQGYQKKKRRLNDRAADKQLVRRQEKHLREIEARARDRKRRR